MSDPVLLAIIAVVSSLVSGTVVVGVGVWADGKKKRAEAGVAAQAVEQNELVKVRMEYRERIERLEKRLDEKDAEIRTLTNDLGRANVVIARQETKIEEQAEEIAELRSEVDRLRERAS